MRPERQAMADGKKRRYITTRVDAYLREKFGSNKLRRPLRENCESCWRYVNFCKFCLVCSVSLFQVLAPWVLSIIEVTAVTLIYLLATSRSVVTREAFHFSYRHSLEDIVALCMVRAIVLSSVYTWGMHLVPTAAGMAHRPYLYTSYLLAASCFPYIVVKTVLFRYTNDAIPAAAIFIITGIFTWFHVFAARRTVEFARRTFAMSLAGSSVALSAAGMGKLADSTDPRSASLRRPELVEMSKTSESGPNSEGGPAGGLSEGWAEDVPSESLADDDSRFIEVMGIKVHYKEFAPACLSYGAAAGPAFCTVGAPGTGCNSATAGAAGSQSVSSACSEAGTGGEASSGSDVPQGCRAGAAGGTGAGGTAIVLVHGYGGGVFAWRHVMEALALQCQCRVVAFDRPAFGLTERLIISSEQRSGPANPYALDSQVELMMQLCAQLGIRKVLLVAHGDACLMALRAASLSAKTAESGGPSAAAHISLAIPGSSPVQSAAPGSSHAFSVLYSGSSTFVRPSVDGSGSGATSGTPSTASVSGPPPSGAGSMGGAAVGSSLPPWAVSAGAGGRTVLRMRAQATPSSHGRDGSPPLPSRSPRSPRASSECTSLGPSAGSGAQSSGPGSGVHTPGLPPLPPPLFVGPPSETPLLAGAYPGVTPFPAMPPSIPAGNLPPVSTSQGTGAASTLVVASSIDPWAALSPSSIGEGPWSPCEVPAPGYTISAAAAAAAAAAAWDSMTDCSGSLDGMESDLLHGGGHRPGTGAEAAASMRNDVQAEPQAYSSARQYAGALHASYRPTADSDVEAGPPLQHLHSCSSLGLCPRPLGTSTTATPLSTIAISQGQTGPRHRRTLSTGSGAVATAAMLASQQQQQQQQGAVSCTTCVAGMCAAGTCCGCGGIFCRSREPLPWPTVIGMAMLHPNLEPRGAPTLSRLLAGSGFGGAIIRPLLRSELGDVANRRAWYSSERMTPEVLELYRAPLRVQGWDAALLETVRLTRDQILGDVPESLASAASARSRPMLVLTAVHDSISTPNKAEKLCQSVPHAQMSVLADCGHLSHEEAPTLLLQQLVPFCGQVLQA